MDVGEAAVEGVMGATEVTVTEPMVRVDSSPISNPTVVATTLSTDQLTLHMGEEE